jgi:hypothetical protein
MPKHPLGKSLGDLMNGDQVAGKSRVISASASSATTTTTDVTLGRGLSTLVSAQGAKGKPEQPSSKKRQLLPPWFFFAADLLLLAYVVGIIFDAPRPFDLGTILFCAVSVTLGCLLAIVGMVRVLNNLPSARE